MIHPIKMTNNAMECTKNMTATLWRFLEKNRGYFVSINIATVDNELTISFINNKKIRRFKNTDNRLFMENIRAYVK